MSTDADVRDRIERAAEAVAPVWPLHSFVTANPLGGFENRPFREAVRRGEALFSGAGYPDADVFRRAWTDGRIDPDVLAAELTDHGYEDDPEALLDAMAARDSGRSTRDETRVDAVLTKWLARFLDQGAAHWAMPDRERGCYTALRGVARHDREIPDRERLAELPDDPVAAIEELLADHPRDRWRSIFEHHLTALPGWTGYLRRRIDDGDAWQSTHPVTLPGYLAFRLALTDLFGAPLAPPSPADGPAESADQVPLPAVWLSAWEATYRAELVDAVTDASAAREGSDGGVRASGRPDAQLVFCIDTRSEIVRRHLESTGGYETHGYAGFFGIPMRYRGYDADVDVDACPPIVDAEHRVVDCPTGEHDEARARHDHRRSLVEGARDVVAALRTNVATAFSFVEAAGAGYGVGLAARTLLPARAHDLLAVTDRHTPDAHEFCAPSTDHDPDAAGDLPLGLTLDERVEYAATAVELMGWESFARLAVFVGHASRTAANPFDSSLDCGACAGNPGGPNARVLAAICNDEAVRARLRDRDIEIPDDTVFLAGEHNTTTDEIRLYAEHVPESHRADLARLRADLETARAGAAAERAADMGADADSGIRETERRAADWAETRPEWGLAGNAALVVGPRGLTDGLDLDGRCFLHSYDWRTDPDGDALAAIMTGPMIVTQWINAQYYFATVDNAVYGSGSKVTHNAVGNLGVYQGNGGDLMTGLPSQSLTGADGDPYHQPLRLSTVVHAPVERVTDVLTDHEDPTVLLDNGWLSLTVVDPSQDHRAFHYDGDHTWRPAPTRPNTDAAATDTPSPVDD